MSKQALIECVTNFSEGRDLNVLDQIQFAIQSVDDIRFLHRDIGYGANRTVMTFAGPPTAVTAAAFNGIRKAAALIDMQTHQGEHPRLGATDVCPLIPLQHIDMGEVIVLARDLAERVGEELGIPVYLYGRAARTEERRNLADIRRGEYEGLPAKLLDPHWQPDFGPKQFNARAGATVIGARPFLIAYNVNLRTNDVNKAKLIASRVRASGYMMKRNGQVQRDANGKVIRVPGLCEGVKAIGWYIPEYGHAQVSMNITDLDQCSVHEAFEACREQAAQLGVSLSGSELIGLAPRRVFLEAGRYYASKDQLKAGLLDKQLIAIAVRRLGLDDLGEFPVEERIIEHLLEL